MLNSNLNPSLIMKNKFETIQSWIPLVLESIKKEIRTDHLVQSPAFARTHFGNRPLNRISSEEIFDTYQKELLAGNEDLADWVVNRWVFKHGDVYEHFAERLSQINPDFGSIEALSLSESEQILAGAPESFGYLPTYLFCHLNGVVFPEEVFIRLRDAAVKEIEKKETEDKQQEDQKNLLDSLERKNREVAALQQKYEQKVAGVMRKYTVDIEALKKQVRSLQHQLNSAKASV